MNFFYDGWDSFSEVAKFYFVVGWISGFAATVLIPCSVIGMFLRPVPRPYAVMMEGLAIALLITSTLLLFARGWEIWSAVSSENKFERFMFEARISGLFYWLEILSAAAPQLFWLRRFRRSFLAILLIAIGVSTGIWFERLVIAITASQQEFLLSSWKR